MATQDKDKSQEPGTRAPNAVTHEAPRGKNSGAHIAKFGNDAIAEPEKKEDGAGMPDGYKPDTSETFHAGKDGKPDQIKDADGTRDVDSSNPQLKTNAMEKLPEGHTYRDRIEAQARSLGIEIDPKWTEEYLLWVIRMKGSS